jgi:hypothetical protein
VTLFPPFDVQENLTKEFGEGRFQRRLDRLCSQGDLLRHLDRDLSDVGRQMRVCSVEVFIHDHLTDKIAALSASLYSFRGQVFIPRTGSAGGPNRVYLNIIVIHGVTLPPLTPSAAAGQQKPVAPVTVVPTDINAVARTKPVDHGAWYDFVRS